jgi:2'-5' RNA ligase
MNCNRRLFFALWPKEAIRQQIKSASYSRLKPKTIPPENWHMTLVFLGPTPAEQRARLEQAASKLEAEPFTMSLDTTGQFKRAQVVWLGCQYPDRHLLKLQEKLESALRENCLEHPSFISEMRPYCPHLTLYRHIRKPYSPERIVPIEWPVDSFCLIESRPDQHPVYRILNRWELDAKQPML